MQILIIIATSLYFLAAGWQIRLLMNGQGELDGNVLLLSASACSAHAVFLYYTLTQHQYALSLSMPEVFSLIFICLSVLILFISAHKPLTNLLIFVLPMSAVSLILIKLLPPVPLASMPYDRLQITHIVLSIAAFSLLCAAALQAVLLAIGEYVLKAKRFDVPVGSLPPLQTMEKCLFQLVAIGFCSLSLVLATSFLFFDGVWAGPLRDKALLTLIAWAVFLTLLLGRWFSGWRGRAAINGTLLGMGVLILSYFGTRLLG